MNSKAKNITLLSGAIIASLAALQAAEKDTKPNLILINIDDLGWADVGYNGKHTGSDYYETPNIDRLHAMGVNFHQGYASAGNSAPSRASLLSGLYSPRHKVYTVHTITDLIKEPVHLKVPPTNDHIPSELTTLPTALRDGGYKTCHIGKWHVGTDPTEQGIDLNIGGNHTGGPSGGHFGGHKNPQISDKYNAAEIKGKCLTKLLGDAAVTYIDTVSLAKPFFISYAPYAVHTPIQADPKITAKYKAKKGSQAHKNPKYAAMIEAMDNTIGTIMKALEDRGIAENTVVVFTADNGGVYNTSKQWPLRAGKGSFYEGGIREPFIVYQKGKIEGGRNITDVSVGQIDIFPTFMEMAGISYDGLLDGESLVPILTSDNKRAIEERYLYWHFPNYLVKGHGESTTKKFRAAPLSVVRHKEWKLIQNYDLSLGIDEFELYNIASDISEKTNLAADMTTMPAEVRTKFDDLRNKLTAWIAATDAPIPQAQ